MILFGDCVTLKCSESELPKLDSLMQNHIVSYQILVRHGSLSSCHYKGEIEELG